MNLFHYSTTFAAVAFAFVLQSGGCPQQKQSATGAPPKPPPPVAVASPTPQQAQSAPISNKQTATPANINASGKEGEKMNSLATGMWGGAHVRLDLGERGATLEYDCAHGTIDELISLDAEGRFDVRGTHETEQGGAITTGISVANEDENNATAAAAAATGAAANTQLVRYVGLVKGDVMTLSVIHADTKQDFGTFTLKRGASARLFKCLQR